MPRRSKDDLAARVARCLREKELGKKHYKISDALMEKLEVELEPGQVVELASGKKVEFRDKGSHFSVGQTARRFEFKILAGP